LTSGAPSAGTGIGLLLPKDPPADERLFPNPAGRDDTSTPCMRFLRASLPMIHEASGEELALI